jgi:hypothetical protein
MRARLFPLTLIALLFSLSAIAQDTLITGKNYKYKFGAKLQSERSIADNSILDNSFGVMCGGLQLIRKIANTKSSFESGIYFNTKAREYYARFLNENYAGYYYTASYDVYYHYLSIPVNFRLDTKSIYFSVGVFFDYLLNHTNDERTNYFISRDENYGVDRKFLFGYNLNLGVEKSVSDNISVFMEARIAATVSSAKTDGGFVLDNGTDGNLGHSNINYGFGIGINYKLLRKSS